MDTEQNPWTKGSLRILSEKFSVEDITSAMSIEPTRSFKKGDLYSKRNPNSKVRDANLWLLESALSDQAPIESHIEYFLSILGERTKAIKSLQKKCEFSIACAYFSESDHDEFTIDNKPLKALAAYPIYLNINLYPPHILI